MNSRLRKDCATIFDICCSLQYNDKDRNSEIKVLYPQEFTDESLFKSIKQFCFPYSTVRNEEYEAVQLFTFVLTDAQSLYTFGYCRFTPRTNSCICILSGFLWVNLFYKMLNQISAVISNGTISDVESLLTNAYHLDIPEPGSRFKLTACTPIGRFSEVIPNPSYLPTLRDDKFLLELYNALNERQMIQLYSSLLKERRIIFTTSKLSQLSSCVFGLSKLLYPFNWQSLFIPILPMDLTDMLMAPMPYLIGVPKQRLLQMNRTELGDVIIMDLDEKLLTSPYQDKLPAEAYNFLRNRLKSSGDVFLSDSFSRAFLLTNVILFGNYTLGFVKDAAGIYTWHPQNFVEHERPNLRPYLHSLIGKDGVQYFERFIEERLQCLNEDNVIIDEFEREIQKIGVRRQNNHGVLPKPPEIIQHAVSSMKENAADVFGVLKDQFQSISVKEKLSTMKTKDRNSSHRRARPFSSNGRFRSACSNRKQIDPLTIDTSQFDFDHSNPSSQNSKRNSDAVSVHSVDDLIDLNDDRQLAPAMMTNNIHSSPNLQQQATTSSSNVCQLDVNNTNDRISAAPCQSMTIPTATFFERKYKWETFE